MDGLNAAGWTLPAAAWSSMVLLGSLAILLAPRGTRWPEQPAQPKTL
jgi:hypothetical protein